MPSYKEDEEIMLITPKASKKQRDRLAKKFENSDVPVTLYIWRNRAIFGIYEAMACEEHGLYYKLENTHFQDKKSMLEWVCKKHLENIQNLNETNKKYIVGKYFNLLTLDAVKLGRGDNQYALKNRGETRVSYRSVANQLGEQYFLSHYTVEKYGRIAESLDKIYEINPTFTQKMIDGSIRMSFDNIIKLAEASKQAIMRITSELVDDVEGRETRTSHKPRNLDVAVDDTVTLEMKIKTTPEYNPDVELNSLAFTVPSWKNTIDRLSSKSDIENASDKSKNNLMAQLKELTHSAHSLIFKLEDKK